MIIANIERQFFKTDEEYSFVVLKSLKKLIGIFKEFSNFLHQKKILNDILHCKRHPVIKTMHSGQLNNKSTKYYYY